MRHSWKKAIRAGIRVAATLLFASAATSAFATPGNVPITIDDMLNASGIGDAVFSPDGQSLQRDRKSVV